MNIKFKCVTLLLLVGSVAATVPASGPLALSGAVFHTAEKANTQPRPWAQLSVYLFSEQRRWIGPSMTDFYGRFAFIGIKPGTYLMRIYNNRSMEWEEEVMAPTVLTPIILGDRLQVVQVWYSFNTGKHGKYWSTRVDTRLDCAGQTVAIDSGHNSNKENDGWPRYSSTQNFQLNLTHTIFDDQLPNCTFVVDVAPTEHIILHEDWIFDVFLTFNFSNGTKRQFWFRSLRVTGRDGRLGMLRVAAQLL
jgi:hypothetical protein